jgi:hypothetical protein
MGLGWITCNLSLVVFESASDGRFGVFPMLATFLIPTGMVIFGAWLAIFLPADLIVPETSTLRRPFIAAVCGAVGGFLPLFLIQLVSALMLERPFSSAELLENAFGHESLPYVVGAVTTGLTAAVTLVLRHPRKCDRPAPL